MKSTTGSSKKRGVKKLITQKEFAGKLGISPAAVNQHVKNGKITLIGGKIDAVKAEKELNDKTDPGHGKSRRKKTAAPGNPKRDAVSFNTAKTYKEGYKAKLAELEYRIKTKEYVKAADVEHAAFSFARKIRDKMLNIPDRIQAEIQSITGLPTQDVRKIIKHEIETALKGV